MYSELIKRLREMVSWEGALANNALRVKAADAIESQAKELADVKESLGEYQFQGIPLSFSIAELVKAYKDRNESVVKCCRQLNEQEREFEKELAARELVIQQLRGAIAMLRCKTDPKYGIPIADEALAIQPSTEALDAYVAEKVKDATKALVRAIDEHMVVNHQGVFNFGDDPKEALNKIACFEQELGAYFAKEQLAKLTRQRDLAVSALEELTGVWYGKAVSDMALKALSTLKESEG